jgi:outer membrane lipoprotein carrier protein
VGQRQKATQRWVTRCLVSGAACASMAISMQSLAQPVATPATPAPAPASAVPAGAEPADAARDVARAVQTFYDQTRDVTAAFNQTYVNKLYKRTDRSSGKVVFKKPGMMRWDYAQPNGKVIASTGKTLTVYEPGDPGEPGQVIEQSIGQAQLPQALAFLMGTGKLEDDFTFRLLDATAEGFTTGDVLELRPKTPTPHFDRLLFYVERAAAVRGLVRRMLIIDSSGNRNRFDFSKLKFNSNVDAGPFKYTPPAGTRRVEM